MTLTTDVELIPFDAEIGYGDDRGSGRSCVACSLFLCGVCQLERDTVLRSAIVADLCDHYATGVDEF